MDTLPRDPFMLYSYINMKLRDQYPTLDELCASEDIDKATLINSHKDREVNDGDLTEGFSS